MRRLTAFLLVSAMVVVPAQGLAAAPGGIVRLPQLQAFGEALSDNGRYVAFASDATTLVAGDTNGSTDVFVYDRGTGTVQRVSVATDGTQANGGSGEPSISTDGRYVSFTSNATNLVPSDTNGFMDVFVRDRTAGTTLRTSVSTTEQQLDGDSDQSKISGNGSIVVFHSRAPMLLPLNSQQVIVVRNRLAQSTQVVGTDEQDRCNCYADNPRISANGRYVAWRRLQQGTSGDPELSFLIVHDRTTGVDTELSPPTNDFGDSDTQFDDYDLSDDANIVAWSGQTGVSVLDRSTSVTTVIPGSPGSGVAVAADGSRIYSGGGVLRAYSPSTGRVEVLRVVNETFDVSIRVLGASVHGPNVLVNTSAPNLVAHDPQVTPDDFLITSGVAPPTASTAVGNDVVVQSDNKVLVAATVEDHSGTSDVAVFRYTAAGILDDGFGVGGVETLVLDDQAAGIAVQADGRIVILTRNASVYRLTSTGALDDTFGDGGVTTASMRIADDILVDAQGRLVISGTGHIDDYFCEINPWTSSPCDEVVVQRLLPTGAPDTGFGDGGVFALGSDETDHEGGQLAALGTGYVVLGTAFGVIAVSNAGILDPGFGVGGIYSTYVDGGAVNVVAGQPVFAVDGEGTFDVTRLTSDGIIDASFGGGDGKVEIRVAGSGSDASLSALGAAGNGQVYVGGWAFTGPDTPQFILVRLTASESLDTTFSGDGEQTIAVAAGGWSRMEALRVMRDGRVVLAGEAVPSSDREEDIGVARLVYSGSFDPSFGDGDGVVTSPYVPT